MPINRFDTAARAQFQNTYVPIPFAELAQYGQMRQGRYDENMARLDAARAAADKLKYIPNSKDQETVQKAQRTLETIADSYIDKDLSDPEVYRGLRSDLRSKIDSQGLNDIQESYSNWAMNQKMTADLKRRGLYHEALDQNPALGYNTLDSEQGIYTYQTESMLDSRKAAEQYFNQLKPNQFIHEESGTIRSGVSQADISRSADENLRSFIDTNEGRQAVQLSAYRNKLDYSKLSEKQKENMARQYLQDVGQEFVYNQETPLPAAYLKARSGNQGSPWSNWNESTPPIKVGKLEELKMPTPINEGNPETSLSYGYGVSFSSERFAQENDEQLKANSQRQQNITETKKRLTLYNPDIANMEDEEFVNAYNEATNSVNNQSIKVTGIPDDNMQELIKNEIIGNIQNKNFALVDVNGIPEDFEKLSKEAYRKMGVSGYEDLKELISKDDTRVQITQDYREPGMYSVEIPGGKKGKYPVRLFIGSNNEVRNATSTSFAINKAMRTLNTEPIPIPQSNSFIQVIPKLKVSTDDATSSTFDYDLLYGTYDNSGNFIPQQRIEDGMSALDAIKKAELDGLKESNVHGTNIDYLHLPGL